MVPFKVNKAKIQFPFSYQISKYHGLYCASTNTLDYTQLAVLCAALFFDMFPDLRLLFCKPIP